MAGTRLENRTELLRPGQPRHTTVTAAKLLRLKWRYRTADPSSMDISSIALQGLANAEAQADAAATTLATAGANSPSGANLNVVDVSKEIVALTSAENLFEMNVDTLKTVNQIQQNLIDSWAEFFELPDVAGVL